MAVIKTMFGLNSEFLSSHVPRAKGFFVAGAELEIESVEDYNRSFLDDHSIVAEEDGSLRNSGKEFLLPPSKKNDLTKLFRAFHSDCVQVGPEPFTIRTSTHIHVNMMTSTDVQVRNLLLLYAIFEPLAFAYCGENRKQNIHCVPLNMTHMPILYKNGLQVIINKWHKYTAFNLIPLVDKGTIEFRHLYGTSSTVKFEAWLNFIETLWTTAHNMDMFGVEILLDLTFLKEVEKKLLTPVFVANCAYHPEFVLEDNLLDVKLAFI